ncbi:receptor-type tyrosine-protein kinase FLT3 [Zeugodacus cucurbitae]|uniref:receptor-type tyrosine-protein kinase FLT3 n=1 Tax=Zeugodacus cucurbitae TaxID=28588 RepID=UPI0005968004|nr:receptor-type tyrosine-protein kinase FLT3 [Zeugodacus cucurbitae]XP_011177198.1 receptor-type tyrosine-protein kinase FLT3 [Zeugodacus cucurbitae]XP_054086793.1 receptor-type tyrosine-protein kinase FLT3 [Zeugodacus cucurbitae]XP_054086794.1 receptor-type tyrosine-protein kinase FLT3 [Zeugodacus cucurbitae]
MCSKLFSKQCMTILWLSILTTATLQLETSTTATTTAGADVAGAPAKRLTRSGRITGVTTNVTLHERGDIVQFLISWDDNLPKDTSYNVIVTATNATKCSEPPCSVYGIVKETKSLIIPENPMTHVDQNECGFMFGCDYSVLVETSNTMISERAAVSVPYCIMGVCSCQHAETLPKVITSVDIPNNETIIFNWSIRYEKVMNKDNHGVTDTNSHWKLYLSISEQTNPSLSWGGRLLPITEHLYPIKNVTQLNTIGTLQGAFKIHIPQQKQLMANTVLKIRSYIVDDLHCGGPEHFSNITVPDFFKAEENVEVADFDLGIALIILSALFLTIIVLALTFCCWKRNKIAKFHDGVLQKDEHCMSPFSTMVEMEDNINYVDKYVEEAQAKGLADVFEIPHKAVHIGPEIGEGAFGRVYKAVAVNIRRMRGSTVVAVKQLKKNPTSDEVGEFLSEIEMLKGVGTHNNIVCFFGCCTIRPPYLMIMEFVGRGDLLTYLRTVRQGSSKFKPNGSVTYANREQAEQPKPKVKYIELKLSTQSVDSECETERQPKTSVAETTYTIVEDEDCNEPFEYILDHKELHNFALQIANGMRFLEEQEITHRDLAARNVLIDDRKTLKISDFGLSRHGIYTNTKTRKLPLRWLSIEAIRDNIYSNKSDVWAYGVVLWEIGTLGASPYPTISNHELIPFLLSGKRLEKPEICTDQVYAIMMQCWDESADSRPTFEELYKALSPSAAYVDINSLSDDYVFPPI